MGSARDGTVERAWPLLRCALCQRLRNPTSKAMLVRGIRKVYEAAQTLREHAWLGYAFAVLTCAGAMYVRVLLSGVLEGFPFITFFVALVLTAFTFGWRAGALCAVFVAIVSPHFLLPADWCRP